jgi:exodeoxyribonuclease VII large subunit
MAQEQKERIYTIGELTRAIAMLLEAKFPAIWVEGEISNLKTAASGHTYFVLKDSQAQLSAVMFRGRMNKSPLELKDGLKVRVYGSLTVYKTRGQYQLIATRIQPVGLGELQQAFEALKKKLYEKGLFDDAHKKPVPIFPQRIGVVTSPTGAAIRDFLNVLDRRYSNLNVIINPVRVQGAQAPPEIVQAIRDFNRLKNVDVIIVTRGGGSIEDLCAFNDEKVALAIFDSTIPVISAVGHEIDWTIADFVSDLRVPTPSAAAELVIARKDELKGQIKQLSARLGNSLSRLLERSRSRVERLLTHYIFREPANFIRQYKLRLDDLSGSLQQLAVHRVQLERQKLQSLQHRLSASNPRAVFNRGYSLTIARSSGKIITDSDKVAKGDSVITELKKGKFSSIVE